MISKLTRVRGLVAQLFAEGEEDQILQLNNRGDLMVAQALPPLAGQSWQVSSSAGVAALTALPTTTAGLSLWVDGLYTVPPGGMFNVVAVKAAAAAAQQFYFIRWHEVRLPANMS